MIDNKLLELSSDFFQNSLASSPSSAIMRGYKEYFDQIEELTEETFNKEEQLVNEFIYRLDNIDLSTLSHREQITHGMLEFALSSKKDALLDKSWEFGAGVSGYTGYLIDYNQRLFIPDVESADMLLKRLELYEKLFVEPSKKIGSFFWKNGDIGVIDKFGPNGISKLVKMISNKTGRLQTGFIYDYAFVMLLGLSILLTYLILK